MEGGTNDREGQLRYVPCSPWDPLSLTKREGRVRLARHSKTGQYAAVKIVTERPLTPPENCLRMVATPTGSPVLTSEGGTDAGVKSATSNVPVTRMAPRYDEKLTEPGRNGAAVRSRRS